jgi:hypothetical protein
MLNQNLDSIPQTWDILELKDGLSGEVRNLDFDGLKELVDYRVTEMEAKDDFTAKELLEFNKILLNSNFWIEDSEVKASNLAIGMNDNSDDLIGDFKIEKSAIDLIIELLGLEGFVVFKHNPRKIRNNSEYDETALFHEKQIKIKTIARPFSELRTYRGSVYVDYIDEGVTYRFELLKIRSGKIEVNSHSFSVRQEDFENIVKKFDDFITVGSEDNGWVYFTISNYNPGSENFRVHKYFTPLMSAFMNKMKAYRTLIDVVRVLKGEDIFKEEECGNAFLNTTLESGDSCKFSDFDSSVFDEKVTKGECIKEFRAKSRLGMYDDLFLTSLINKEFYLKLVRLGCENKNYLSSEVYDWLCKEFNKTKFQILRLVFEEQKIISGNSYWIATNFGQVSLEL